MKVLVVSNDSLQCEAIKSILEEIDNIKIIVTYCENEALTISKAVKPNLYIVGYRIYTDPHTKFIDKLIKNAENATFIQLLPDIYPSELTSLMTRPISAILHLTDAKDLLSSCIECKNKEIFLSPKFFNIAGLKPDNFHSLHTLSRLELKITSMVLQGYSSRYIAKTISRSYHTVEDHRKKIKNKLSIIGGKNAFISSLLPYTRWIILTLNKI